jgi:capping protein beta
MYIITFIVRISIADVENDRSVKEGIWDSIHVVEVKENKAAKKAEYKLTTTIMLHMGVEKPELGSTLLSGSLTRQTKHSAKFGEEQTHIANIGRMIEDMETDMRSNLGALYILKTREVSEFFIS